jgi:signal transduction histidine kinase
MPEGGTLTLIGRKDEKGWVFLDVIDTGCGMTEEVMAKLFKPFHTTKKEGNGLGLATARKVILAHGGTIEVQSEYGRGSKFTIRLPASRADEAESQS